MTACRVCGAPSTQTIFTSAGKGAITSLATVVPQTLEVTACTECSHVQSSPLFDLDAYYRDAYKILLSTEEEDQIYAVVEGAPVYRADHQADTLLQLLNPAVGARVLDFGAAKGATFRCLARRRPDLKLHLFDVSDMYRPFWQTFSDGSRQATFVVPPEWAGTFDAVTSFFVLEHVEDLGAALEKVRGALRDGGRYYFLVPNFAVNTGDLIVADHVNHFTADSLRHLLSVHGFEPELVDQNAHQGAWLVIARRSERNVPAPKAGLSQRALTIAAFWSQVTDVVRAHEQELAGRPAVIYGAGFYGTVLWNALRSTENMMAFVDQNPHLQGRSHLGRPVIAPSALPGHVHDVLVGLNPATAREAVDGIAGWKGRALSYRYLGPPHGA